MDICVLLVVLQLLAITTARRDRGGGKRVEINLRKALENESKCGDKLEYPEGHYHCTCDPDCARYGDCCRSSEYFKADQQLWGLSPYSCQIFGYTGSYYVISSCPPHWDQDDTRKSCEDLDPFTTYPDPLLEVPVISVRTNITYRNGHCAICNQDIDPETDVFWNIDFVFDAITFSFQKYLNETISSDSEKRLYYDLEIRSWVLNVSDLDLSPLEYYVKKHGMSETFKVQNVIVKPPSEEPSSRACVPDVIGTCAKNWSDVEERGKCESYTDIYFNCPQSFRNPHCALCNNVDINRQDFCNAPGQREPDLTSFSVLLDWKTKRNVGCSEREKFDPLSRSCRKIAIKVMDKGEKGKDENEMNETRLSKYDPTLTRNENPVEDESSGNNSTELELHSTLQPKVGNKSNDMGNFPKQNLNVTEMTNEESNANEFENTSIPRSNVTDNDLISNDTDIELEAANYNPHGIPSMKEDLTQAYITAVGVGISIMCLVLHLIVFVVTPKLRNMPAMNLASLCVSLLILYSTFIAGVIVGPPCRVIAILTHYGLLVTFCWMLAISFDVWRAIRQIINDFFVPTEMERRKRFLFYSTFSWIFPALIVILALIFEFSDTNFRPDYGTVNCWITNPDAVLAFSFVPLCVIMGCDVIFFCWSAYLVCTSKSNLINSSTAPPMDFQIFIKLGLMMGLTWITGLVAASVNVKALWYVFILLNTLQGCFIFIAFSCTRKVWKEISSHFACCHCKNTSDASPDHYGLKRVAL